MRNAAFESAATGVARQAPNLGPIALKRGRGRSVTVAQALQGRREMSETLKRLLSPCARRAVTYRADRQ